MSKRERKQYRKELFRKVERRRRLVGRVILILALTSMAGLVASLVLSLIDAGSAAIWVAGPTGLVILAMAGFIAARAIMLKQQKRKMSFLGWAGLVGASIAGLQLLAALILLIVGQTEASELTGVLSLVPVLVAIGFFLAEWTKDIPSGDNNNVDYLTHIINN